MQEDKQTTKHERFTQFMFGPGTEPKKQNKRNQTKADHSSFDFDELYKNIDSLVESVQKFKPLYEKAYPYVQQYLKKK